MAGERNMDGKKLLISDIVEQGALQYNVSGTYLVFKRLFDVLLSFFSIILLSPIFLIIIIAIKSDSRGPAIFTQYRCGMKGRVFKMYKFRSMVVNAEELKKDIDDRNDVSGHVFKLKNDPRITRVGRFIRKTSIDELPQLFNVLKNDMSFVGPRPPLEWEVRQYDVWHNLRMSIKPGITGLWQVNGRNDIGFEDMVRLDLKYIRERSFRYDLKIVFRTVPLMFGDKRAF